MGLFDKLKKKTASEPMCGQGAEPVTEVPKTDAGENTFVMGALDVYSLKDSEDCVVMGRVKGTIRKEDAVYVSEVGRDDGGILLTTVEGLEDGPGKAVEEATDCAVSVRLKLGMKQGVKPAMVLHSRSAKVAEVHNEYINALGDIYVGRKQLVMTKQEAEALTVTDCAEIYRLFAWFHSSVMKDESEEQKKANKEKANNLGALLCKKLLDSDSVYCVFNKRTGEPHLFSKTIAREDGEYLCTPPEITLLTKAYKQYLAVHYPKDQFEIKEITKGEDGKGIYNFLGSAFYLNGACGVRVLSEHTSIAAPMLVLPPDYSNLKPQEVPVTNPDLVRWMLLIGQMGEPDTADKELIYKLYYKFFSMQLVKAKLLIPMKKEGEIGEPDQDGNITLKADAKIMFPTMRGKQEKEAVYMYTDWKRLRMAHDEEWGGLVQTVEGMIKPFDCAINVTEYTAAGCYVNEAMFEDMKRFS